MGVPLGNGEIQCRGARAHQEASVQRRRQRVSGGFVSLSHCPDSDLVSLSKFHVLRALVGGGGTYQTAHVCSKAPYVLVVMG